MNPYAILAAVLIYIASAIGAAWLGYDYRKGKEAQGVVAKQANTINKAIANAGIDRADALKRARDEGAAQERARLAKSAGVQDATFKARPDCGRDDVSLGLLDNAIDAANGSAPSSRGMSKELRIAPQTR